LAAKLSDTLRAAAQLRRTSPKPQPPATEADRARVLATVNGRQITSADIEDNLRPLVFSVQEEVYKLRRQEVELKVNDLLLNQEAQRRKLTTPRCSTRRSRPKCPPSPTPTRRSSTTRTRRASTASSRSSRNRSCSTCARSRHARRPSRSPSVCAPPRKFGRSSSRPQPPAYKIATDGQPTKGSEKAAVTLVEFTDYQCPSCAKAQPALERLVAEYGDRVRLVVRDYPLTQHKDAQKAAEAAEAAREQGKYWEYTALLFQNQSALQTDKLKEYATRVGLDRAKFDAALDSGKFAESVHRDLHDGDRVGVQGTPTVFLNGRRVVDISYEGLKAAVESALSAAAQLPKAADTRP
jgi:protein-disulfide isomerase